MPFVCTPRVINSTDGGVSVQITDLFPHKTQSSAVLTPNFQGPKYLYAHGRDLTEEVATQANVGGDIETDAEYAGLSAYLLATIEKPNGEALTDNEANTIADLIIARMEGGLSLTASDINTALDSVVAGAGLAVGDSLASALEVLQIVSGYKVFTLPANTVVELAIGDFDDAGLAVVVPAGFADPSDASRLITTFESSFYLSARRGQLKVAQTRTNAQGVLEPLVVCYADDGSLIQ